MTPDPLRPATTPRTLTRRSAIGRVATGALVGATTGTFGISAALAQDDAPATSDSKHVRYELRGDGIEVTCEFSQPGEPRMTLQGRLGDGTFEGRQIESSHNPHLGEMVSATVDWVADAYTLDLTLLVPQVNLKTGEEEVPISTIAILTKHHQNIGGPTMVKGPLQSYQAIELTGTFRVTGG